MQFTTIFKDATLAINFWNQFNNLVSIIFSRQQKFNTTKSFDAGKNKQNKLFRRKQFPTYK